MPHLRWSIPALLLLGAVVWAQSPSPNPTFTPASGTPRREVVPENPLVISPETISQQTLRSVTRTIGTAPNEDVIYGTMNIPPSNGGAMPGMSGMGGLAPGPMKAKQVQRTVVETQYVPLSEAEVAEQQAYQAAVATLRSDKPDDEKKIARSNLAELLTSGFQRDLESREKDLQDLEARVQKLRSQIEKRKAAKQDIIELRLKTIQNEVEGLEYPGAGNPPAGIIAPQPIGPYQPAPVFVDPARS